MSLMLSFILNLGSCFDFSYFPYVIQWVCPCCTYVNHTPSPVCEMCCLSKSEPALSPSKPLPLSPVKDVTPLPAPPKGIPTEDPDFKRQRLMREEGLKLIQLIRVSLIFCCCCSLSIILRSLQASSLSLSFSQEGEKKGVSPEEVYTSMSVSGNSNVTPHDWLKAELPHVLDEICVIAASCQQEPNAPSNCSEGNNGQDGQKSNAVPLSRAEAKRAWLAVGGDNEKAVRQALRDRRVKVSKVCPCASNNSETDTD